MYSNKKGDRQMDRVLCECAVIAADKYGLHTACVKTMELLWPLGHLTVIRSGMVTLVPVRVVIVDRCRLLPKVNLVIEKNESSRVSDDLVDGAGWSRCFAFHTSWVYWTAKKHYCKVYTNCSEYDRLRELRKSEQFEPVINHAKPHIGPCDDCNSLATETHNGDPVCSTCYAIRLAYDNNPYLKE